MFKQGSTVIWYKRDHDKEFRMHILPGIQGVQTKCYLE